MDAADAADVFVYGTLTDPDRVADLLSSFAFVADATLLGLRRVDGRYPTLAPGGETTGRVLRTTDIETLDEYEGVDRGLYVRVAVPRADGEGDAAVYVGRPDRLGVGDAVSWPGDGPLARRVREYVAARDVRVQFRR